jgi:4-amino-4-deoxy-L-arabinose transferase-like glycosyltransferase
VSPRGTPRVWPSAAVVFVVALAVRLAHVLALRASPYFARPVLDAETYYWAARALAAGEGWAERVYWQPPGYPYFLAAVLRVAGPGFLAPRLVQAVLGALTAALTCALGARVFGSAVGLGAGLVVALYGLLIYYDAEFLPPSLAISLQMATLWAAARAPDECGGRGWCLTGLLGGLTAVVNAPALVLLPILGIAARRRIGWVLLGAILAIAPVTARNWIQGRELVVISSNGGINLYLGNNPRYDETVGLRPGREWQALVRAPALQGVTGAGPASRFFTERVSAYAGRDPGGFVRLQVRKIGLLLQGNEIPRNQEIYPTRAWSPVLRALLWKAPGIAFPFGLLLPLAVVGLGVAGRRAPVLAASVVLLGLTVVAFFVTARYRAALVPLLALFAAAAVRWAVGEASPRARLAAAGAAAAVYVLANVGQGPMSSRMNADAEQGLAHWLESEGRRPEALALYERLAQEAPTSFDAWYGVAQLATALGQPDKAGAAVTRIRGLQPEFPDTAVLLARAAIAAGCGLEAEGFAARALALDGGSDLSRRLMAEAATLRASPAGSPAGGCPDRVFVAPLTLPS